MTHHGRKVQTKNERFTICDYKMSFFSLQTLSLRRFGYSLVQSLKRALLHKGWTLEGADFVWIKQQL